MSDEFDGHASVTDRHTRWTCVGHRLITVSVSATLPANFANHELSLTNQSWSTVLCYVMRQRKHSRCYSCWLQYVIQYLQQPVH